MSRGGRTGVRTFVKPGIRAHAMKFNVGTQERRRLRIALQTLEDHRDAIVLALRETSVGPLQWMSRDDVVNALRLLCFGPNGEFR